MSVKNDAVMDQVAADIIELSEDHAGRGFFDAKGKYKRDVLVLTHLIERFDAGEDLLVAKLAYTDDMEDGRTPQEQSYRASKALIRAMSWQESRA